MPGPQLQPVPDDAIPMTGEEAGREPQAVAQPDVERRRRDFRLLHSPDLAANALAGSASVPQMQTVSVRVSRVRVFLRLLVILRGALRFCLGLISGALKAFWKALWKRSPAEPARRQRRAAKLLRETLSRMGGTFVKVGQQMSMRADILPPIYCEELRQLLDSGEACDPEHTRRTLEKQLGRPVEEVFATPFDYDPIGKASIACVYKARMRSNGKQVAIKVRRPGIDKILKADLAALGWVAKTLEFFTLLRPGISQSFRAELQEILMEELDFQLEARYQELFRRDFKKRKKYRITAPKVYHELSGKDVIVSEFVEGDQVKDLMRAVERNDKQALASYRRRGIDPKVIAKRLVRASYYGFFECTFFHGDPHPANIFVQPGNRIVMIDFGACGAFAEKQRNLMRQMHYYQQREDVGGMVQCVTALMEPLPPIDIHTFRAELEREWWLGLYGTKSKHAQWWERTSFRLWSKLLTLVRKHHIPIPLNMLRMIRATLLYDTVGARLYSKLNVFKEYRKYAKGVAKETKERIQREVLDQLFYGPSETNAIRLQRMWDVGDNLLFRLQQLLAEPQLGFTALVSKGYDLFLKTLRLIWECSIVTAVAVVVAIAVHWETIAADGRLWRIPRILTGAMQAGAESKEIYAMEIIGGVWLSLTLFLILRYSRQIWFRLQDKDDH